MVFFVKTAGQPTRLLQIIYLYVTLLENMSAENEIKNGKQITLDIINLYLRQTVTHIQNIILEHGFDGFFFLRR